jgi:sec-independent protein translocase protein TatA
MPIAAYDEMTCTIPDPSPLETLMIHPMIGMPQGAEWLVILAIVVLVFGAAKLPELARGTGQALRIFKTETKGLRDDDDTPTTPTTPTGATELPPATDAARTQTTGPTSTAPTSSEGTDLPTEPRSDKHTG